MLRLRIGEQGPVKLRIVESSVHGLLAGIEYKYVIVYSE